MTKLLKKLSIVLPTALFLAVYLSLPGEIVISKGEKINLDFGMTAEADTEQTGNFDCDIKLFNFIPIKTVSLSVLPEHYVIPSGEAIGIKLHTEGVLVIDTGNVTDENGKIYAPAKKAGLKKGDRIIAVNGEPAENNYKLKCLINEMGGKSDLTVVRGDDILNIPLSAAYSKENGIYQIGAWVKDSAAGIGTLTFYDPQSSTFAALGHGICDCDTDCLLKPKEGTVNSCKITNIVKSQKGSPGELIGEFSGENKGSILLNCDVGVYGKCSYFSKNQPIAVASRFEITEKEAEILCDIDGAGPSSYKIEITKIYKTPISKNKSFVFKVTDPLLIDKANGIVQGMSGSPILQNGKIIGAVTHVFVNDSKKGYGIFAENMLDITNKIK